MQTAGIEAHADGAAPDAGGEQLAPRDAPALGGRERRDPPID